MVHVLRRGGTDPDEKFCRPFACRIETEVTCQIRNPAGTYVHRHFAFRIARTRRSFLGRSPAGNRKDNEISLLDLLIVLAERKNIILGVTAVFAIFAIIISLVLPKRYTATVTLLPPQQGSSIGAGTFLATRKPGRNGRSGWWKSRPQEPERHVRRFVQEPHCRGCHGGTFRADAGVPWKPPIRRP